MSCRCFAEDCTRILPLSINQILNFWRYRCLSCGRCKSCCLRQTVNILPVFLQFKRNAKVQEERKVCSHSRAANGEESSVLLVRHSLRFPQHSFNVRRALWSTQMAQQVSRLVLLHVFTSVMRRLSSYFGKTKLRVWASTRHTRKSNEPIKMRSKYSQPYRGKTRLAKHYSYRFSKYLNCIRFLNCIFQFNSLDGILIVLLFFCRCFRIRIS